MAQTDPLEGAREVTGAMQGSHHINPQNTGSGSSQNLFLEIVGRGEKAAILWAAFVSVAISVYALSRMVSIGENFTEYKAQQRELYHQTAENYRTQTEALTRAHQAQEENLRAQFKNLETQYRVFELKNDDLNVTLRRAGLKLPGDETRGPMGNPDAESFNIKLKRESK